MILLSIWLLFWNEGNFISQHKALEEGLGMVISVDSDMIGTKNRNQLVHFTGKATTSNAISDEVFCVVPPDGALKLKRIVQMYQWKQHQRSKTKTNTGGSTTTTTTFTYSKEWSDHLISSSRFEQPLGHQNPPEMLFESSTIEADPITVGGFTMSSGVMGQMNWYEPLTASLSVDNIHDDYIKQNAKVFKNYIYIGGSPTNPTVGDTRVSFKAVPQQVVSIVGKQTQSTITGYRTKSASSILLVEKGDVSAEEMFLHANKAATAMTWLLRFVGMIIIWCGYKMMAQPLQVLADTIPFIGIILETANNVVTFFLAFATSSIVIAIAWLAHRPLVSMRLLVVVLGVGYFVQQRGKNAKTYQTNERPNPPNHDNRHHIH